MDDKVQSSAVSDCRVIVGSSTPAASEALRLLVAAAGYCVVGVASCEREIVDAAVTCVCDLAVIDVSSWASADVLALCEELKFATGLPVLLATDRFDRELCRQGSASSIDGVLMLPVTNAQLIASVELALMRCASNTGASGTYALEAEPSGAHGIASLSARELEVFRLLARGYRPSEVGRELFISAHTVRKHAKIIFRKLGVHSHIELMRRHFARAQR